MHDSARSSRPPLCRAILFAVVAVLPWMGGCSFGGASQSELAKQNDELRRHNLELERQTNDLRAKVAARQDEIKVLQQQVGRQPAVEGAAVPTFTTLTFDRFTSAVDRDRDGGNDALRLYLKTLDQEARFIPVSGRAEVQVVVIEAGQDPVLLTSASFDPDQFARCYRSGITGTHYTLDVNLPTPVDVRQVTVKVTITDAATGAAVSAEIPLRVAR